MLNIGIQTRINLEGPLAKERKGLRARGPGVESSVERDGNGNEGVGWVSDSPDCNKNLDRVACFIGSAAAGEDEEKQRDSSKGLERTHLENAM
jgi:hypothetical protein